MEAIELRRVKTAVGDGLLFGERLSGSGFQFMDILIDGVIRTFAASSVRIGRKSEKLSQRYRKLFKEYKESHPVKEKTDE